MQSNDLTDTLAQMSTDTSPSEGSQSVPKSTKRQMSKTSISGSGSTSDVLFGEAVPKSAKRRMVKKPVSTGLFGSPAPRSSSTGLFGSPAPAPRSSGTGLFGSPAPAPRSSGTGLFGSPAPSGPFSTHVHTTIKCSTCGSSISMSVNYLSGDPE